MMAHHVGLNGVALHVLPALQRQPQLPALDAHVHERRVRVHVARHVPLLHVCRQLQRSLQLQAARGQLIRGPGCLQSYTKLPILGHQGYRAPLRGDTLLKTAAFIEAQIATMPCAACTSGP